MAIDKELMQALRPLWGDNSVREAFEQYIGLCLEAEEDSIKEMIQTDGHRISLDRAVQRKIEYHATRRDLLAEFFPILLRDVDNLLTELPS